MSIRSYGAHNVHGDWNRVIGGTGQADNPQAVSHYLDHSKKNKFRLNYLRNLFKGLVPDYTEGLDPSKYDTHKTKRYLLSIIGELCLEELELAYTIFAGKGSIACIKKLIKLY